MKHLFIALFFFLILCPAFGQNNIVKTAGVSYTAGAPTFTPGRTGSQVAIDTVTGLWYEHNGTSWSASGYRVQTISGCSAPAYTPAKYQSRLVINACTAGQGGPELYYYTGSVWLQINEGQTYTAGTGIDITGTTITNTAPNVVQTLSIAGQDLTLSGGGGTVEIPTGKDTVYVVLSGQSNAWGATPAFQGDTTSSTKVQVWNGAYWARAQIGQLPFRISSNNPSSSAYNNSNNLGLHFCKKLSEYTGQIVRLILSPFDGNSITNWIPTGSTNFTSLNGQVSAAGVSRIDIFLWHQGEADNAQTNSWYVSKFDTLKQQLRAESWFPVKTPIIVGGLLVGGIQSGQDAALQAIGESSDPWVAYASSDGLVNNGIDNVHFSGSSLVVFGDSIYWKSYLSLPRTVTTIAEPLYQTVFGTTAGVTSDPRNTYNSSTGKQRYSETGTAGYTEIDKSIVQNPDTTQTLQSLHRINSGKSSPYAYAPYDRKFQYIAQIGPYQNYVFTDGYNSLSDAQPIQSAKPMYQKSIYTSIIEGGVPKFGIYDRFRAPDSNAVILSGYTINYKNAFNPSATPYFDYSQAIDRYRLIAPTTGQPTFFHILRDRSDGTGQMRLYTNPTSYVNISGDQYSLTFNYISTWASKKLVLYNLNDIELEGAGSTRRFISTKQFIYQSDATSTAQHTFNNSVAQTTIPVLRVISGSNNPLSVWYNRVGIGTASPATSAALDVTSTTHGVLLPRMTTAQRDAIASPATGLTLYCTDCTATDASTGVMQTYNGATWKNNW